MDKTPCVYSTFTVEGNITDQLNEVTKNKIYYELRLPHTLNIFSQGFSKSVKDKAYRFCQSSFWKRKIYYNSQYEQVKT